MRLTRVRIEGFRSVKKRLELEIDPRVTVLLGPNDHGKSNVLLALSHLRAANPLTEDDRNWDTSSDTMPRLTYYLGVEDGDRRRALGLWKAANPAAATADQPKMADIPAQLTVVRQGIGSDLEFADTLPPAAWAPHVMKTLPGVELFEPALSIPDSVTAAEITEPEFEFMQGIFMYAGLKREEWPKIFDQNDVTLKRLEGASKLLNRTLRQDWSQGRDLQFELRHHSAAERIALHIKDTAVKTQWVRASNKSSGFTHYFALRTRMYARTAGKRHGLYLWLFDEPGVWLHPAGQFDLMQALEALAKSSQIVYSTHSVFLINRNFPSRHRLVVKSARGTELDAKPFVSRWNAALDALGFSISGTLLFAPCVVLAEGDSDPVLIYPMLQRLAEAGLWDRDINSLSIMATGDLRNTEAIARLLLEGAQKPRIAVLVDGDRGGIARVRGLQRLVTEKKVTPLVLPDGMDTEDYVPAKAAYLRAVADAAAEAAGKPAEPIFAELESRFSAWEASEATGFGRWSGQQAKEIAGLDETPSKVVIARAWAQAIADVPLSTADLQGSLRLAEMLDKALSLPPRATESGVF